MSDNVLKKEFKERDVQRLRNIVSKKYNDKTVTQIGYNKETQERKEGDIWEENNKTWTIQNGIKMNVTKLDSVKKALQTPLACPKCKKAMNKGQLDKYMYLIHKICSNCVIEHETELKRLGKFEEYQKEIIKKNIQSHIKDMEDALLDLMLSEENDNFVTEAGDVESWKNNNSDKFKIEKELRDYIQSLKDVIGS